MALWGSLSVQVAINIVVDVDEKVDNLGDFSKTKLLSIIIPNDLKLDANMLFVHQ